MLPISIQHGFIRSTRVPHPAEPFSNSRVGASYVPTGASCTAGGRIQRTRPTEISLYFYTRFQM